MRNPKLTFKPAMVWEPEIEEFVRAQIGSASPVLNVPCGHSKVGDIRIDLDFEMVKQGYATEQGDMMSIEYPNCYFGAVVSDPVWKLNYYLRWKQFFELVRVCKVKGRIIFNATWIPFSKATTLQVLYVRQSARFANCSLLSVLTKDTDEYDKCNLTLKEIEPMVAQVKSYEKLTGLEPTEHNEFKGNITPCKYRRKEKKKCK